MTRCSAFPLSFPGPQGRGMRQAAGGRMREARCIARLSCVSPRRAAGCARLMNFGRGETAGATTSSGSGRRRRHALRKRATKNPSMPPCSAQKSGRVRSVPAGVIASARPGTSSGRTGSTTRPSAGRGGQMRLAFLGLQRAGREDQPAARRQPLRGRGQQRPLQLGHGGDVLRRASGRARPGAGGWCRWRCRARPAARRRTARRRHPIAPHRPPPPRPPAAAASGSPAAAPPASGRAPPPSPAAPAAASCAVLPPGAAQRSTTRSPGRTASSRAGRAAAASCTQKPPSAKPASSVTRVPAG